MKLTSILIATVALSLASASAHTPSADIEARSIHPAMKYRHRDLVVDDGGHVVRKRASGSKRSCKAKTERSAAGSGSSKHESKAKSTNNSSNKSQNKSAETNSDSSDKSHSSDDSSSNSSNKSSSKSKTSSDSHSSSDSKGDKNDSPAASVVGAAKGLFGMSFDGQCSSPDASEKYPNGHIKFLNCGISQGSGSGWKPPKVKLSDIKVVSAEQASKSPAFKECAKYKEEFEAAEKSTGVPAVFLMSFAMQESTCNPNASGGNGEVGMMQLTPDKCKGVNCHNAGQNIKKGAEYFKSTLSQSDDNVLQAIGQYNGWKVGMTFSQATSTQYGCSSQNNLDYLNQFLNGWAIGKTGYDLTVFNNLAKCG